MENVDKSQFRVFSFQEPWQAVLNDDSFFSRHKWLFLIKKTFYSPNRWLCLVETFYSSHRWLFLVESFYSLNKNFTHLIKTFYSSHRQLFLVETFYSLNKNSLLTTQQVVSSRNFLLTAQSNTMQSWTPGLVTQGRLLHPFESQSSPALVGEQQHIRCRSAPLPGKSCGR